MPTGTLPYDCPQAMDPPAGTSWAALLARVPPGVEVLDVGCATGSFAVALSRKGCRVTGIEVNPEAAEVARTRCAEVHVGDVARVLASDAFTGRRFEVVVAADVLEHLVDPAAVLRAVCGILRPGGIVLASLPNVTHTAVVLEMCHGRFSTRPEGLLDATHLHFFGEGSALALFADTGFRPEIVDRVRLDPRHTEFATRLEDVPDAVIDFLDGNPSADTYQFIIQAVPGSVSTALPVEGESGRPVAPLRAAIGREVNELRETVRTYHDAAVAREDEMAALHETLVEKDRQLAGLHGEIGAYHEAALRRDAELTKLAAHAEKLEANVSHAKQAAVKREAARRALARTVVPLDALRVLYVTSTWDAPGRYRCQHAVAQLRLDGVDANVLHVDDPRLLDAVRSYSVVVLFRLPWSERVATLVTRVREQRATLLFDVDDLLFEVGAERLLPFFRDLDPGLQDEYLALFPRLRRTAEACDAFIGSTPALVRAAARIGAEAFLHPNLVSDAYVRLAPLVRLARAALRHPPTIAYLSGSNTHDRDFASIDSVLARLFTEDRAIRLLLCGYVNLPAPLRPFGDRITSIPYVDWRVYPWALARARLTVAPMAVINEFTNAKSALKFFEAGIFGIPTVATPTESLRDAIVDGENGFLAGSEEEWLQKIRLALDPERARVLGERARATVLERFSFAAHRGRLMDLLRPLTGVAAGRSPVLLPIHPVLRGLGPVGRMRRTRDLARAQWRALRDVPSGRTITLVSPSVRPVATPLDSAPAEALLDVVGRHGPGAVRTRGRAVLAASTGDLARWTLSGDLQRDATGRLISNGPDPRLVSPALRIRRGEFRYLVVRMAAPDAPPGTLARFCWIPEGTTAFAEENSVGWVITGGGPRTYVIDLATTPWAAAGAVHRLRLDPVDCPGPIELEHVTLIANLAQLDAGRPVPDAVGARYLRGQGLVVEPAAGDGRWVLRPAAAPERDGAIVDPSKLPMRDGAADFYLAGGTVPTTDAALAEALRVVRPGGTAVLHVASPGEVSPTRRGAVLEELVIGTTPTLAVLSRGSVASATHPVDIVVPVYNARKETLACVDSVLRHARGDWRLVIVDDASTDTDLVAALEQLAAGEPRIRLLRNAENLGFVRTANRGMEQAAGRDVLLLNSDTIVAAEFLERLQACAHADESTGIVSPLSNNATICSVPNFCEPNSVPVGFTVDQFAALVAASSLQLRPELVTAVGFCMYVRTAVLARVGHFDAESFPRGYGEENDLCERAIEAGFTVRLADDVYVYHVGEASFRDASNRLKQANYEVLERLHPDYFARVAAFIAANPLAAVHRNLALAMRRRTAGVPALLIILHASFDEPGGGTEHHVRDLVAHVHLPRVVVVTPAGAALQVTEVVDGAIERPLRYRFPLARPVERHAFARADVDEALAQIVRLFGVGAVHIQHLLDWPITAWRTLGKLGLPIAFTAHDYYAVCPSLNLIDVRDGQPCCVAPGGPRDRGACMRHLFESLDLAPPDDPVAFGARHRAEFASLLAAAAHVVFPSTAARDIVARFLPLDARRSVVIPHGYDGSPRRAGRDGTTARLRVALLGEVAHPQKGARQYLALLDRCRHLPIDWHVFGGVTAFGFDDALRALGLGDRLVLHGRYARDEISARLAAEAIDLVVLLPTWPETFSYTLSEALAAGVPAIVSTQGALVERIDGTGRGIVVHSVEEAAAALERFGRDRAALRRLRDAVRRFRHPSLAEMAARYRPLYDELLAGAAPPLALSFEDRRRLFAAHEAVTQTTPPVEPLLPHYGRWWYPAYERLVARLVPQRLRSWGRAWVAGRVWRPVRRYRFDRPGNGVVPNDGLELVRARGRAAVYRVLHEHPAFVIRTEPFPPRAVRLIRFEMRCQAKGHLFAQLYWTHADDESFSEEKSLQVRIEGTDGQWHEYRVQLDETAHLGRWHAGESIRQLRFDPLNVPSTIEIRGLQLCARTG